MRRPALAALLVAGLLGLAPSAPAAAPALVVPAASATLPATWHQVFRVRYGKGRTQLGTSPGGDSGTLLLGPDYGAPGPDGSWWFLDAAKRRLAHYSATGHYLGSVTIPTRMLVQGVYFQWQLPHVLANGWLVATRQSPSGARLLRLRGSKLDEIAIDAHEFFPVHDDGKLLYGFAGKKLVTVDPRTGATKPAPSLRTSTGSPFSVSLRRSLKVTLPSGTVTRSFTSASGARAHVGLQIRAGADGAVNLFLTGIGEDDESRQLVGFTSVLPSATVSPVEALPNPFTEADTGSPAQLAMVPGSSTPMLVYVLPDGVHVYARG